MFVENYNIHNLIKFQIISNTPTGFLKDLNPEYKYFHTTENIVPDYTIIVTDSFKEHKSSNSPIMTHKSEYDQWSVQISEFYDDFLELQIIPHVQGARKIFAYTAIKNLYVRSLMYYCLLKKGHTLVHSCGFNLNGRTCLLAGRPGVFKTSILMDAIREYGASFLGEENVLLADNMIYPFPINIESLIYKLNNFDDENPSNKFEKIILGLNVIFQKNRQIRSSFPISEAKTPDVICYLSKSDDFQIMDCDLENIISELVDNEIQELSIPPTHSLSGIKYNYLKELFLSNNSEFINHMRTDLFNLFQKQFHDCKFYKINTPEVYDISISKNIIGHIIQ